MRPSDRNEGCQPMVQGNRALRLARLLVAGGDEQLRDLPLVEIPARGGIAGRAERAEHQISTLSVSTRLRVSSSAAVGSELSSRVMKRDLAAVDAAAVVDHVEIGGFRLADRAELESGPEYGMTLPMRISLSVVGCSALLLRHRPERGRWRRSKRTAVCR